MRFLFGLLALLAVPVGVQAQNTFTVVNNGFTSYRIDGVDNPSLTLTRGQTYTFNVTATGHPFYIKTERVIGSGSQFTDGVTNQGVTVGTLTFAVPQTAPATLFYQCGIHSSMGGTLNIISPVGVPGFEMPRTVWLGPAVPNPTSHETSFTFGLPRGARVNFTVFDSRGRGIRVLSSGVFPAGSHPVSWDGRDGAGRLVSSGVYYYRLKVEGQVLNGRLVVTR